MDELKKLIREWLTDSHSLVTSLITDEHIDDLFERLKAGPQPQSPAVKPPAEQQ
jgi:NAD-dependent DNA ligase